MELHWRNVTDRLLKVPEAQWNETTFHEAEQALSWWAQQQDRTESQYVNETTWQLFDRYLVELDLREDTTKNAKKTVPTVLFLNILNQWRKFVNRPSYWKVATGTAIPRPLEMIHRVDEYVSQGFLIAKELDAQPYNMVLNALSCYYPDNAATNIPKIAEEVLRRMMRDNGYHYGSNGKVTHENKFSSTIEDTTIMPLPTTVTFASVMKLWILECQRKQSQTTTQEYPQQAKQALRRVQVLDSQRQWLYRQLQYRPSLAATGISKSIMLNALAQMGYAQRAQTLLEEWWRECHPTDREYQQNKEYNVKTGEANLLEKPTVQAFSTVLAAWSKSGHPKAAERGEALLQTMIQFHRNKKDGNQPSNLFSLDEPPNVVSYSSVLDCWAKSKAPYAAERAEAILRYMQDQAEEFNEDCRPNVVAYTTVIHAWAKRANTQRALALLEEMIHQSGLSPNTHTFNAVLLSIQDTTQALQMLEKMTELADRHPTWDCRPTVESYTTVIQLFGKANRADDARRVWDAMTVPPDETIYNSMLHAYAKVGRATQATDLLKEMHHKYEQHHAGSAPNVDGMSATKKMHETTFQNSHLLQSSPPRPNLVSFNRVLSAWARSMDESSLSYSYAAADQAEAVFFLMEYPIIPNVKTYATMLQCWSNVATAYVLDYPRGDEASGQPDLDESDIVARAEDLFSQLEQGYNLVRIGANSKELEDYKPNIIALTFLCKIYATFGYSSKIRACRNRMREIYSLGPHRLFCVTLLDAWIQYCNNRNHQNTTEHKASHQEIFQHAEDMVNELSIPTSNVHDPTATNIRVYTAFLHLLAIANVPNKPDRVQNVLETMNRAGVPPNPDIDNLVAKILSSGQR